jgi:hypothetical protein
VTDVIYPARAIAVSGAQVTINRGDGTNIAAGQTWGVFRLGEELKDPDTGESLGREETLVGKVRIMSVQPKTAKAEVVEGSGIAVGDLLRLEASVPDPIRIRN